LGEDTTIGGDDLVDDARTDDGDLGRGAKDTTTGGDDLVEDARTDGGDLGRGAEDTTTGDVDPGRARIRRRTTTRYGNLQSGPLGVL
jgi:hypothetical protein